MANEELCFLSATEMAALVERHEVSPLELVDAHLERVERLNDTLHAYLYVAADEARQAARAAEQELAAGHYRGPLHGIPVAYKDIVHVQGMPTTAHSRVMGDYVATEDATIVARLRAAGAIALGKLNTHEFAGGSMEVWGYARNPWATDRIPGGSSSGSGAAVAAHLVPLAVGTDTGGSVRIPSALCGIVGLKATYGRISRAGILPLSWSLDGAGPMARTTADVAAMFGIMAGRDPRDPTTAQQVNWDFRTALTPDLRGVRVGVPREYFFEGVDPDVERNVRAAVDLLRQLGVEVREVSIPSARLGVAACWAISAPESFAIHRARFQARRRDYGDVFVRRISPGAFFTAEELVTAQRVRQRLTAELVAVLHEVDLVVTPSVPSPAYPVEQHAARQFDTSLFTRPISITGLPALAVPTGFTSEGLPTSMQLVGRAWDERTPLRVAHGYERAAPRSARRAPLQPGPAPAGVGAAPAPQPPSGADAEWARRYAELLGLTFLDEADFGPIATVLGPIKATLAAARDSLPPEAEPPVRPAPAPRS